MTTTTTTMTTTNEIRVPRTNDKAVVNAYICGHLDTEASVSHLLQSGDWQECLMTPAEYSNVALLYHEPFINSMATRVDSDGRRISMPEIYSSKSHLRRHIDRTLEFRSGENVVSIHAPVLDLYRMPQGIWLWSIKLEYTATLDDVTWIGLNIREADQPQFADFRPLLTELYALARNHQDPDLVATGNKFKIFQHVMTDAHSDSLLYELGCLLPVNSVGSGSQFDPDPEYYREVLKRSRLGVYSTWTALSLVDTFTILASPADPWNQYFDQNFRYIYLNCIYQKSALTLLNRTFRSSDNSRALNRQLEDTVKIERWYGFSQISYNFLPQMLYEYMDTNMEIHVDRQNLHEYVEKANELQDKKSRRKLDWALAILTILSISSILFDTLELCRNYLEVTVPTLRMSLVYTLIALVSVVLVILLIFRIRDRHRKFL